MPIASRKQILMQLAPSGYESFVRMLSLIHISYRTEEGVSFTVSSHGATSCVLLLFRPAAQEPYARIRIPESYKIGNTYSILVFGLKAEDFEYAYQMDGPADQARGLLFNRKHTLLDPYAKAVTGQRNWGEKPEGGKDFVYKALSLIHI